LNDALSRPSSAAFHVVNIGLHGLTCVMLALFVQTIPPNRALAAAAALLFATHPVQHGGRHGDRGSYRQIPLTHSLDSPATTQAVVGGFVAAAGLCAAFWGRSAAFSPRGRLRALPGAALGVVVLLYGVRTAVRNVDWWSAERLSPPSVCALQEGWP
jgi:hypothetical protein